MQAASQSIYKTARRAAGFTQESAAERLGISVESLRAYETSQRIPPDLVVERMVAQYNNISLAYQHLHENNILMAQVLPQLEQRSVLEVAVRIFNRMKQVQHNQCIDRLMSIAEDGHIDKGERVEFDAIVADLREIIKSSLELEVFCSGHETVASSPPR